MYVISIYENWYHFLERKASFRFPIQKIRNIFIKISLCWYVDRQACNAQRDWIFRFLKMHYPHVFIPRDNLFESIYFYSLIISTFQQLIHNKTSKWSFRTGKLTWMTSKFKNFSCTRAQIDLDLNLNRRYIVYEKEYCRRSQLGAINPNNWLQLIGT